MVADQKMHLARVLTFQSGDQVEQLVRTVAARRVTEWAVNDLLQDKMSSWVVGEVGFLDQTTEVLDIAVQIARGEYIDGALQDDDPAAPARRRTEGVDGALQRG
jgi:hypothetical protein